MSTGTLPPRRLPDGRLLLPSDLIWESDMWWRDDHATADLRKGDWYCGSPTVGWQLHFDAVFIVDILPTGQRLIVDQHQRSRTHEPFLLSLRGGAPQRHPLIGEPPWAHEIYKALNDLGIEVES